MEEAGKGRAKITDSGGALHIIIPGKKHPIAILFSIFFGIFLVGGWSTGLVTVVQDIQEIIDRGDKTILFLTIPWIIGWNAWIKHWQKAVRTQNPN